MRVRKPTSKRTSTRMREGIKKKAAAHRRKEAKLSKKNPQWKSRKPKDAGIPSNFPYKEEILEEIEAKKRAQAEARALRKQQKSQERQEGAAEEVDEEDDIEMDGDNQESSLAALVESAQQAALEYEGATVDDEMEVPEEDAEYVDLDLEQLVGDLDEDEFQDNNENDKSMKAYSKFFKAVVSASDVILYVLDARDPEGTRSKKVEEAVLQSKDKKLILLLNKVDLVSHDIMTGWINYYKERFPIIPIKGSSSSSIAVAHNFNKNLSQSVTATALLSSLKSYALKTNLKRSITVGVVGFPNVGKSSIINALTSKHGKSNKACPVGNQPGITTNLREIKIDNHLKIIDSPGIVFPPPVAEKKGVDSKKLKMQQEAKLILLNAVPNKLIKDPQLAIQLLIRRIHRNPETSEQFQQYYDLPVVADDDIESYTKQVLIHVSRVRGRLGKGGVPNLHSAAMCILNDWKDGRFVGWTVPPETKLVQQMSENTEKINGKVNEISIVDRWSKEFDLDELFKSVGVA